MLPFPSGGPGHLIDRSRRGIDREANPSITGTLAKAKVAGRAQRQSKYFVEMRLVAVPADAGAGVVFGAENLRYSSARAPESLYALDQWRQPFGDGIGSLQTTQSVVVTKAE